MYKGNIYEFVEELNVFLKSNNSGRVILYQKRLGEEGWFTFHYESPSGGPYPLFTVYDREDFEEQLLDKVKKLIKQFKR